MITGETTTVATTNDLKNGLVLNLEGQLWTVVAFQHVKPGKGGAFVRTTLKHVLTGKVVDKTFNAGTKVDTATVDKRGMTYLYKDGADFVFMDGDTYDQMNIPAETVGDAAGALMVAHGFVVVGENLAVAVMRAVLLERACRNHLSALAAGGPARWSDDTEIAEKRALVWSMSQYQAGYDYLVRRASDDPTTNGSSRLPVW